MAPLPPNPYPSSAGALQYIFHQAYQQCLLFEEAYIDTDKVFLARTLGYLILNAPSDNGRLVIAREILSVPQGAYDTLAGLANFWIDRLIRCFKSAKGPTPLPSLHPSRPSFDGSQRMLDDLLQQPPGRGTFKQKALVRDQYRCVLTGVADLNSFKHVPSVAQRRSTAVGATQAAHILPASLNEKSTILRRFLCPILPFAREWTTSVWTVLDRFAGIDVKQELNGVDIHNLSNIMTLCNSEHALFDNLDIWLEATGQPNEYKVCAPHALYIYRCSPTITFTTTDPINYPVPSPRYLAIHAATAVVSHLSGAGEYIDKIDRERELGTVLASDGGSAALLEQLLFPFQSDQFSQSSPAPADLDVIMISV